MENSFATSFLYSVMDLFGKIKDAIDRGAASIQVTYDTEWGYPQEIAIDYDEMMADEEFYVTVSNLTVVNNYFNDTERHLRRRSEWN